MIVGILVATSEGPRSDRIFTALLDVASIAVDAGSGGTARLPQVHALNCLKDAFTDTRLASMSEAYASTSLTIAARCLDSEVLVCHATGPNG